MPTRAVMVCSGLAVVLALAPACGGSSASSRETATAAPQGTTPQPPAAQPPRGAHGAPELEALLPPEVDGRTLQKRSATGASVFGGDAFSRRLTRFLVANGKQPGDLRFANASDPEASVDAEIGAFRVEGVEAARLRDAIVDSSRPGAPGLTTARATLSGKRVTKLVYASGATLYLYAQEDVVFYVGTASEETAARVLEALP